MMLEATEKNVHWLLEKLYDARRYFDSSGRSEHPVFVLLTKGPEDRHNVEQIFWKYFTQRYGSEQLFKHIQAGETWSGGTRFEFQTIRASVVLLDL